MQVVAFNLLLWVSVGLGYGSDISVRGETLAQLIWFFGGSLVLAALTSMRFTRPIRRALRKALRVSSKKHAKNAGGDDEEELFEEEPGEYSELEVALDRIEKKLRKRKDQLTREREENTAFMSSVQEGLISVSPEGRLLYFNSQFAALFLAADQIRSEEVVALTDSIRVPEVYGAFRQVLETGVGNRAQVRLTTRLDNQPRDFSISMNPLRHQKTGVIRGVIGVFHDITDLKKAERIRIEFVGNASHELRTPLTSIKGYLETIKDDFAQNRLEQVGSFLQVVSRNVDRLIDLVNDLLSLSALEHNPELQLDRVNALALSDQVIKELTVLAAEKNHMIRVTGEVPPFVADPRKVEQVLRNLVSNAIKYIPDGKQIHVRWESSPRSEIILRVGDNGPGIPEEHHQRLFERFYRIDKGRSRDAGGTGLGLAIVKHIMQSHGGSVSVKSQPGVGSEFTCIFPPLRSQPQVNA